MSSAASVCLFAISSKATARIFKRFLQIDVVILEEDFRLLFVKFVLKNWMKSNDI